MITVISTLLRSSHHYSPIFPDQGQPARSIPALPFTIAARAPIGSSPMRCRYFGCCTQSRGHHMTAAQPCVMQAASSAVPLVSRPGPWGFQPPFHAILVSYTLLMSLYRAQDRWTHICSHSRIRGSLYAFWSLAPGAIPRPLHADSCLCYRDPLFHPLIV